MILKKLLKRAAKSYIIVNYNKRTLFCLILFFQVEKFLYQFKYKTNNKLFLIISLLFLRLRFFSSQQKIKIKVKIIKKRKYDKRVLYGSYK